MTNFAEIDQELSRATAEVRRAEKLHRDRKALNRELTGSTDQVGVLEAQLDREVAELEEAGLKKWLGKLFGGDDRPKHEAEVASLRLRLDTARQVVDGQKAELARIDAELAEIGDTGEALRQALAAKEAALVEAGGEAAQELAAVATRRAEAEADVKEHEEALAAGKQLRSDLFALQSALSRAESVGTWDVLGGGNIVTAVKHQRLDDARSIAAALQQDLAHFDRELDDIGYTSGIKLPGVEVGSGLAFADFLIDGLITDLMVQKRIDASLGYTEKTIHTVSNCLGQLETELAAAQQKLKACTADRDRLLGARGADA